MKQSLTTGNALLNSFLLENAGRVTEGFECKMKETGLRLHELVLELNFSPSAYCGGEVPALRDPAEFNIGIITRITDGNRLDEPVWIRENSDPNAYEGNAKSAILNIRNMCEKLTPEHYLIFVMYPADRPSLLQLKWSELKNLHVGSADSYMQMMQSMMAAGYSE